jgi:hypothetical protein
MGRPFSLARGARPTPHLQPGAPGPKAGRRIAGAAMTAYSADKIVGHRYDAIEARVLLRPSGG